MNIDLFLAELRIEHRMIDCSINEWEKDKCENCRLSDANVCNQRALSAQWQNIIHDATLHKLLICHQNKMLIRYECIFQTWIMITEKFNCWAIRYTLSWYWNHDIYIGTNAQKLTIPVKTVCCKDKLAHQLVSQRRCKDSKNAH